MVNHPQSHKSKIVHTSIAQPTHNIVLINIAPDMVAVLVGQILRNTACRCKGVALDPEVAIHHRLELVLVVQQHHGQDRRRATTKTVAHNVQSRDLVLGNVGHNLGDQIVHEPVGRGLHPAVNKSALPLLVFADEIGQSIECALRKQKIESVSLTDHKSEAVSADILP